MIILAVSTSTPRGSAALLRDGVTISRGYDDLYGHAERLLSVVEAVVLESGIDRSQIDALGCDIGPGSFTGVRVGVATAKGIAEGLGCPVVGIGSLEAMAAAAWAELEDPAAVSHVVPLIDARKGEVFAARYDRELRELQPPQHIARERVADWLVPDGSVAPRAVGDIARELGLSPERLAPWPEARWVAQRTALVCARGRPPDAETVVPAYVRAPDAKLPAGAKVS